MRLLHNAINRGNRYASSTISWQLVLKIVANCANRNHMLIVAANHAICGG